MSRNPFGVQDVPDPDGDDVEAFAGTVGLPGSDAFAGSPAALEGNWSSRWNAEGIPWRQGHGTLRVERDRVYILFDWDEETQHGLIEARWDGRDRLIGRYLNLSDPQITRPWVGLIVDAGRIDGVHSGGRIDFRR